MGYRYGSLTLALISSFVLAAFVLSFVNASHKSTLEDLTITYTVCLEGQPQCDFSSIQAAVDSAVNGDLIKVAGGTYTGVNSIGGIKQHVYITKSISIRGGFDHTFNEPPDFLVNPTILDAQYQGRVLCIIGDIHVTLEGLYIIGGDAEIAEEYSDGRQCNSYGDYSYYKAGGGIAANGTAITITNSTIAGNRAWEGAGLFLLAGNGVIKDSIISQNSGIGLKSASSTISLDGNNVTNNKGGGINVRGSEAWIINNIVSGNYEGSGVSVEVEVGRVLSNTIIDNDADIPGGYGDGGGISVGIYSSDPQFSKDILVADNLIEGNHAHAGGGMAVGEGPIIVTSNVITGNTANFYGGIHLAHSNGTKLEANEIIANESVDHTAGVAIYNSSDVILTANAILENKGIGLKVDGGEISINGDAVVNNTKGGILLSSINSTVIMTNSTVSGNNAEVYGGGIHSYGNLSIYNSTIANNTAGNNGSNLFAHNQITIANTIIANARDGDNCGGDWLPLISLGNNLDDDGSCELGEANDFSNIGSGLFVLADNGGDTLTHALLPNSPAIDSGNQTLCPIHDQRGRLRPLDGNEDNLFLCDIGAYEVDPDNDPIFYQVSLPICLNNYCPDFFDDFSNPKSGWSIGENENVRYGYVNGEYQIFSKNYQYIYMFESPSCQRQSYVVETDARWVGETGSSYGLIFGISGNFDSFYLFDINTDAKQFRLIRVNAEGSQYLVTPTFSNAINENNSSNHLKVVRNGINIELLINDTILGIWSDNSISGFTTSGVVAGSYYEQSQSDARFDNFIMRELTAEEEVFIFENLNSLTDTTFDYPSQWSTPEWWAIKKFNSYQKP